MIISMALKANLLFTHRALDVCICIDIFYPKYNNQMHFQLHALYACSKEQVLMVDNIPEVNIILPISETVMLQTF